MSDKAEDFRLVLGPGLDSLLDAFASALEARDDPFETLRVVAPNRDVQSWLNQRLAERLGVVMNVSFFSLSDLVAAAAEESLDVPPQLLEGDRLTRLLYRALHDLDENDPLHDEVSRLLRRPTSVSSTGSAEPGLAATRQRAASWLASLYGRYEQQTPALLDAWLQGDEPTGHPAAAWQAELFRRAHGLAQQAEPGAVRPTELAARLRSSDATTGWPVHIFGFAWLSPAERELVLSLAHVTSLSVYLDTVASPDALATSKDAGGLLHTWSGPARATADYLVAHSARAPESSGPQAPGSPPSSTTLLARLKEAVVAPLGEPQPLDGSVRVLGAPGLRREAETITHALWDALLEQRGDNEDRLLLSDLQVLSASYERQVAWLEDRFSAVGGLMSSAPHGGRPSRLVDLVTDLVDLASGHATRGQVLAVLTHPCFRGAEEIDDPSDLAELAGIYLGASGEDEELAYLEGQPVFHWRQGSLRLQTGALVDQDCRLALEDGASVPALPLAFRRTPALAFAGWADALLAELESLRASTLSGTEWAQAFEGLLRMFVVEQNRIDHVHRSAAIGTARSLASLDHPLGPEPLPFEAAVLFFRDGLSARGGGRGQAGTNGITLGRLARSRALPYRVVVLSGLDEGAFPARARRDPLDVRFDLTGQAAGSFVSSELFDARELDQLAFLQSIFSAREQLIFTFRSHNSETDAELSPSPLLEALAEALPCPELFDPERIRQPLTPYSDRLLEGDVAPSHDEEALRENDALRLHEMLATTQKDGWESGAALPSNLRRIFAGHPDTQERFAVVPALPVVKERELPRRPRTLTSWNLRRFLEDPVDAAAEQNLQLRGWDLSSDESLRCGQEPLSLDDADLWAIGSELLPDLCLRARGKRPDSSVVDEAVRDRIDELQQRGKLPWGPFLAADAADRIGRMVGRVLGLLEKQKAFEGGFRGIPVLGRPRSPHPAQLRSDPLRLEGGGLRLEFTLDGPLLFDGKQPRLLSFGLYGRYKPRDYDRVWRFCIESLLLVAAGHLPAESTLIVHQANGGGISFGTVELPPRERAESWLLRCGADLVEGPAPYSLPWDALKDSLPDLLRASTREERRAAHRAFVNELKAEWPSREDEIRLNPWSGEVASHKTALRSRKGFRAPTCDELFDVVENRFRLLSEMRPV
jgi:exonuclease V gamma subunit